MVPIHMDCRGPQREAGIEDNGNSGVAALVHQAPGIPAHLEVLRTVPGAPALFKWDGEDWFLPVSSLHLISYGVGLCRLR